MNDPGAFVTQPFLSLEQCHVANPELLDGSRISRFGCRIAQAPTLHAALLKPFATCAGVGGNQPQRYMIDVKARAHGLVQRAQAQGLVVGNGGRQGAAMTWFDWGALALFMLAGFDFDGAARLAQCLVKAVDADEGETVGVDEILHPADVAFFLELCRTPGKPVNFVPVIDKDVRRWWRSDSLWQAHDARYTADQVCIIPGTQAVAGITRVDEPVGELLDRFEAQVADDLRARGASRVSISFFGAGSFQTKSYIGVPLIDLLNEAVVVTDPSRKNDILRKYVTVRGSDCYETIVAVPELLSTYGHQDVLIAYETGDRVALDQTEGMARLIVVNDKQGGRLVSNVARIIVHSAPNGPQ